MPSESFLVTALPHSADPAAPFHVSLYVGHRLVPDGPQGVVGDFPHVRDWTSQLDGAEVVLWGRRPGSQPEQVPARVVSARQASLWPEVFPPDLLVQPWETKDPTSLPWQTFPASRMDSHARRTHEEAIVSSPVRPPAPTDLTFLDDLLTSLHFPPASRLLGGEHGRGGRSSGAVDRLLRGIVDWDAAATAVLDEGNAGVPVRGLGTAGPWSQDQLVADVHAARRYYQRSEDEVAHQPEPTPGQQPPPRPTPPPQEFHRRLGRLGDLSPLLRALGIVIDLAVDDVGQLTGLTLLSASIVVPGLANGVPSQPQTACAVSGHLFTATTASTRWAHGMLRLGDERLFTLLDLDPDASALKLEQYVRTVPRLLALEGNGNAPNAAPPALRATGFALAEQDRVTALHDRVAGAPAKAAAVLDGTGPPLVLEQVSRGIRLEVWDDVSRAWHSLHRRLVSVVVAGRSVLDRAEDTGFLQGASVTSSDTAPTTAYAHEVLAGWDGWSLAAPRPEKVVVHDSGSETITDPADLEKGVEPVDVTSLPAPGTLPRLRYGRSYAFRAFSVDLAGNSVGAQDHPEAVAPAAAALTQAAAHLLALRRTAVDGVRQRPRSRAVPAFEEQLRPSGPSP
ncbi:MAG: hypothetical protein JWN17_441, partial [Frankiales bacterium]|nr:hypothetical protein [Frankiales bacterium]